MRTFLFCLLFFCPALFAAQPSVNGANSMDLFFNLNEISKRNNLS